jgi:hypothetical protein
MRDFRLLIIVSLLCLLMIVKAYNSLIKLIYMTIVLQRINILCLKLTNWDPMYNATMLISKLYVRVGILLTCGKHLHDCTISLRVEVTCRGHKTSLTLPLFIEVPVSSQGSERSCTCMCVRGVHVNFVCCFDISNRF